MAQTAEEKNKFMKMAIGLSIEGIKQGSASFGAVIVKDGRVIGKGYNTTKLSHDPTAHGEINAIRDACKNLGTMSLHKCDLYTNADPCPMCFSAAYWAGIENIYYGVTKEDLDSAGIGIEIYRQVCLPYIERSIRIESVLRDEAIKVFKDNMKK
jgi:tRNA(Arg) A34 adenosine deaminase TadA